MSGRILRRPRAKLDLLEQALYIAHDNPAAAERFLKAAQVELKRLAEEPGIGSPRSARNPRLQGLRSWRIQGFRSHLIFYLTHGGAIEVVRILHAARDLDHLLEEE